jgi:Flp pilus assembly protein TadD
MAIIKRLFILFCVILSASALASGQSTGRTVRHIEIAVPDTSFPPELTQAENDIEKQNYAAAEPLLQKVVAAHAGNYQAWFDLGFVNNALGRQQESIAAYRKSIAVKPDVFESNLNLGLMLAQEGNPEAAQFLRAATTLKPTAQPVEGHYRAWVSLGHVLEKSKPDDAIAAFHQAALLRPQEIDPHLSAGPLLEGENHLAEAEQEYKQALAINPKSTDAVTALANLYMRQHRFSDAEAELRNLITLLPQDADAHLQLGRMFAAGGQYGPAIAEIQTGLKLGSSDPNAQRDLADLNLMAGHFSEAEAQYRKLLAANPNDAQLHHSLGVSLLREKKFPQAEQELLTAIKLKPNFPEAYGDLAFAASENKDYVLTIKALDLRANFLPDSSVTYFLRASAYDHLRDIKQAAENYKKFLENDNGKNPDQEWQAKHRLITLEHTR